MRTILKAELFHEQYIESTTWNKPILSRKGERVT